MKQLQRVNSELNNALQNTWRLLPYHPETADKEFTKIAEQFQLLSNDWENWLLDCETLNADDVKEFRLQKEIILNQMEQFLTQGKGVTLSLLGRLAEAQQFYLRSMSLLGDGLQPSKGSLAEALGQLALQQAKFNEAEEHFLDAHKINIHFAKPEAWNKLVAPKDIQPSAFYSLEGAARVLGSLAQAALQRGDRELFIQRQLEAIEFASKHELPNLARSLWLVLYTWELQWDVRGTFPEVLKEKFKVIAKAQKDLEPAEFKIDKLLLEAENSIVRNSRNQARKLLNTTKEILEKEQDFRDKHWKLHMAFANYYEWQNNIEMAIEHAAKAVSISEEMNVPDFIHQAIDMLVRLSNLANANPEHQLSARKQLDAVIHKLRKIENGEALAQALIQRAVTYHLPAAEHKAAMSDLDEAEKFITSRGLRQLLYSAQAAAKKKSGNKEGALRSLEAAIQLCREQMLPAGNPTAKSYRDLLHQTETLHEGAAILAAELGRVTEAFEYAEKGKSILLRQQLAQSGNNLENSKWQIPEVRYNEELQQSLQEEAAAFLFFCVGTGRTLALLLDPEEKEPKPFFVSLKEEDLQEKELANNLWPGDTGKDNEFIQLLSFLSDKLITPISDELRDVMSRCEVLYIVPDSRLYLVPFSALNLNGTALVEHKKCALALAPSLALWQWCRQRRLKNKERSCLVVGAGSAGEFSFAGQARRIMVGCNWKKDPTYLLDDEENVTSDLIWKEAKMHFVLHFSCHGIEEPTTLDTLSALSIVLSNHEKWHAKDIFDHPDQLSAELVFLNACMSGRFRLREGLSIGGFWEAFLHAGATSIIATLAQVHPEDAEQLSQSFYKIWLKGDVTKARALQLAQQELLRKKPGSFHWARYILIGDYS